MLVNEGAGVSKREKNIGVCLNIETRPGLIRSSQRHCLSTPYRSTKELEVEGTILRHSYALSFFCGTHPSCLIVRVEGGWQAAFYFQPQSPWVWVLKLIKTWTKDMGSGLDNKLTVDIHSMRIQLSFLDICFHEHQNSILQISFLDKLE